MNDRSLSRREFFSRAASAGFKTTSLPLALKVLADVNAARARAEREAISGKGRPFDREVDLYRKLPDKRIQCFVCPLNCVLSPGETCFCRSRTNVNGTLYSRGWAKPCIVSVDPIEKLPFNNFLPGEKVASIAVGGCNLRCRYCQNWEQSQKKPDDLRPVIDLPPERAVASTQKKGLSTIAFTYTEPTAFHEYVIDIAAEAQRAGVRVVSGTAAFVNRRAIREACRVVDAFAVTLKGFDETFYEKVCGARLKPVLNAIEEIRSEGVWLELTTLIVPTYNDDRAKVRQMAKWIRKNLGSKVPWHFARFVPRYRLKNIPQTPVQTLDDVRDAALDAGIEFVYTSNIAPHAGNHTYCPRCKAMLIERVGFKTIDNRIEKGRCPCGHEIAGIFSSQPKKRR